MMTKKHIILGVVIAALLVFVALTKWGGVGTTFFWNLSREGTWLFPLVVVAAILDSINPCAFSMLLLTIAFLLSIGRLRSRILLIGGIYIAGIFLVYFSIGLGLLNVLHLFSTPHFMGRLGSILLIVLGSINMIGEFVPQFPIKFRIPMRFHRTMATLLDRASIPAAFGLGVLVGLCEFPCTGGPYLMILGLLHDQATYMTGVGYLVFYNLLFVLPLVLILFLASDEKVTEKMQQWEQYEKRTMRLWSGVIMIALGVIIFFL
ncbi:GAP family protein [Candidatus Uhrbacteria bacterium]|nr:GAP family protein [Candidatus Uhrbacteria bacterium]